MDEFNNNENSGNLEPKPEEPKLTPPAETPQQVYPNPSYQYHEPRKKRKGGFAGIIIAVVIVCLLIGGLISAYIIMPLVNGTNYNASPAQSQQNTQAAQSQPSASASASASVQLGGNTPSIDNSKNQIVQIVDKVAASVIGVEVNVRQFQKGVNPNDNYTLMGSGFVISSEGYILTNNHVVTGYDMFKVVFSDGKKIDADLIGVDSTNDIAVLKLKTAKSDLSVAPLGDSTQIKVGETVVAIGSPLDEGLMGTVTSGIVSALDRVIPESGNPLKFIQTDAAINPGNSGGPLFNISGQVIGVNTMKSFIAGIEQGTVLSSEGIGFAIPINDALTTAKLIISNNGNIKRPGIGITISDISADDAKNWQTPQGVLVQSVYATGTARTAGVKRYDIITAVDGKNITTSTELTTIIKSKNVGEIVKLSIWRDGKTLEISVPIGDINEMQQTTQDEQQ
jgi:serine protease Do